MPSLSILGELGVGWRSFSRVDSRMSEYSITDRVDCKFIRSVQGQQKTSDVIDRESSRVRVCIKVTAGFLMVQVHIKVANSHHPS